MHRRAAFAVSVILLPALGAGVALAAEDDPTVGEQEAQVEANQQRQDDLAAQIGLLEASDVELQAELDGLVAEIATAQQAVGSTETELLDVRQRVAELESDVLVAQRSVDAQRDLAMERAVAAYVNPRPGRIEILIGASDINDLVVKDVLLAEVSSRDRQILSGFEAAASALSARQEEAAKAQVSLEVAEREAAEALATLQDARNRQEAVREMLSVRIAEFRGEADALAAQEEALQAIIAERLRPPPTTVPPTTVTSTTTTEPAPTSSTSPPTTAEPGTPTTSGPAITTTSTTTTLAVTTSTTTTAPAPPDPGYGLIWPVSGTLTSPFGPRWGRMHNGIDIAAPTGTPLVAVADGEVFFSGWMGGYGNAILIDHGNGLITLYAHQNELAAAEGDDVDKGEVIGYVGSTGNSTGPHVHFETRIDGVPRDPLAYLP